MAAPLKLGSVGFTNVAPLVSALPQSDLRTGTPAEVAAWLAAGEIDVGLVPTIELGRQPGLTALPDWGIAANGRCDSVLLFSRCPLREVARVALDADSRSSSALVRILLARESDRPVEYIERTGSIAERLEGVDAMLVIGDAALRAETPDDVSAWDLATEWTRHVGLPFVFACWASRSGLRLDDEQCALFSWAAEDGLARLPELAGKEAERIGLPADRLEAYYRLLEYRLDDGHHRGLRAFLDEAHRVGLLSEAMTTSFYLGAG